MFRVVLSKKKQVESPPLFVSLKLNFVHAVIFFKNLLLQSIASFLFKKSKPDPKRIIVYKTGNIGDIACAVPALIAIRRANPNAHICLITSPGERGRPGAAELLKGVWYLDELFVYHQEDIASLKQKISFIRSLRARKTDLFIQLPEDLAGLRTLFRNIILARVVGARSAFGFVIRTIQLFKKAQVDYLQDETEVESLLNMLGNYGIKTRKAEFDFNITEHERKKVQDMLKKKQKNSNIIIFSPGGKRPANRWPVERFAELAERLVKRYNALIAIVGNDGECCLAEEIAKKAGKTNTLVLTGKLTLRETICLLEKTSLTVSNSTGTIHLSAALGVPTVVIDSVRNVPGRWFPYGEEHQVLYHKFLSCDYREEICIKKSIETITVDEVFEGCNNILSRHEDKKAQSGFYR